MNDRLYQTIVLQALWTLLRASPAASTDKEVWREKTVAYLISLDPTPTQEEADYLASLFPLS